LTLKGSFISLTEYTEFTEKDNYHFSFSVKGRANENRYAWQGIGLLKPASRAYCFFFTPSQRKEKANLCDLCGLKRSPAVAGQAGERTVNTLRCMQSKAWIQLS